MSMGVQGTWRGQSTNQTGGLCPSSALLGLGSQSEGVQGPGAQGAGPSAGPCDRKQTSEEGPQAAAWQHPCSRSFPGPGPRPLVSLEGGAQPSPGMQAEPRRRHSRKLPMFTLPDSSEDEGPRWPLVPEAQPPGPWRSRAQAGQASYSPHTGRTLPLLLMPLPPFAARLHPSLLLTAREEGGADTHREV